MIAYNATSQLGAAAAPPRGRIAVVVQRYGEEVLGGAERVARMVSEHLARSHHVEVLTTCAASYRDWANSYPPGTEVLNGVLVTRFPVTRRRNWRIFDWHSRLLFAAANLGGRLAPTRRTQYRWILHQGPVCPALLEYIEKERDRFDLFVFFTYLYYPTVLGLPKVAKKAVFIPTAHDEPAIHLPIYRTLFNLPRFIVFLSAAERDFVHGLFQNRHLPHEVVGIGVDLPEPIAADGGDAEGDYLLYAGRVEAGKGCRELFEFVRRAGVHLKVIGQSQVPIPAHVEFLGFVAEEEKRRLFAFSRALVMPSRHESLSLVVLEAWAHGKPVIVPVQSAVLRAQVSKSGGGYCYSNFREFQQIVRNIDPARGEAGRRYVAEHYSWERVLSRYDGVVRRLLAKGAGGRGDQ